MTLMVTSRRMEKVLISGLHDLDSLLVYPIVETSSNHWLPYKGGVLSLRLKQSLASQK